MKTKTEQLDELFHKWHLEQKKSDFKNRDHFSEDGLIKTDDENCVVLFVLPEPHSDDHGRKPSWFSHIFDDNNEYYNKSSRSNKTNLTKYKNRIEECAKSLGVNEKDIPHGIAVMDMKKCGGGKALSRKVFYKYVDTFAEFIKKQIEILDPKYIVACGDPAYNALQRIGLDEGTKDKIKKTWHLSAQKSTSDFEIK